MAEPHPVYLSIEGEVARLFQDLAVIVASSQIPIPPHLSLSSLDDLWAILDVHLHEPKDLTTIRLVIDKGIIYQVCDFVIGAGSSPHSYRANDKYVSDS